MKSKQIRLIATAFLIAGYVLLVGCDTTTYPMSPGTGKWMPLEYGNIWVFKTYATDTAGKEIASTDCQETDSVVGFANNYGVYSWIMYCTVVDHAMHSTTSMGFLTYEANGDVRMFRDASLISGQNKWVLLAPLSRVQRGDTITRIDTVHSILPLNLDSTGKVEVDTTIQIDKTVSFFEQGDYYFPSLPGPAKRFVQIDSMMLTHHTSLNKRDTSASVVVSGVWFDQHVGWIEIESLPAQRYSPKFKYANTGGTRRQLLSYRLNGIP